MNVITFKNNTGSKIHLGSPLKLGVEAGEDVNLTDNYTFVEISACVSLVAALDNYGATGFQITDGVEASATAVIAKDYIQNKGPIN